MQGRGPMAAETVRNRMAAELMAIIAAEAMMSVIAIAIIWNARDPARPHLTMVSDPISYVPALAYVCAVYAACMLSLDVKLHSYMPCETWQCSTMTRLKLTALFECV